jgi:glucokinase
VQVLAGDIGGTKTLLQLADLDKETYRVLFERRYDSQAYADFSTVARDFLRHAREHGAPQNACFAMAGPVDDRQGSVTNLPWRLDADVLARELNIARMRLINDFQAIGYGIDALGEDERAVLQLQAGQPRPRAPRAAIGAGTGLGESILVWDGDHYEPLPTEGGHVDFAPTDAQQMALLRHLLERFEHVSYERIVSGSGLVCIYDFLCRTRPEAESAALRSAMEADDPAAAISDAAMAGTDALAQEALDLFVRVFGAQAGNLALTCLPFGGMYIAGGIAPKVIDAARAQAFMQSFLAKGRMASLLATVPVKVILDARVGLYGAALAAGRL